MLVPMTAALVVEQLRDDDDPDATIGATVRALVSARRADTGVLARAMGISRNSYYNRVNGEKAWHARDVARAAAFFGVPITDFYDGVVRVGNAPTSRATGLSTPEYPAASPASTRRLRLVRQPSGTNLDVATGYGSSAAEPGYDDGTSVTPSAGMVNYANAA